MKTSIILSLDKRRKKKDGTFPIILRLSHQRKSTSISTGHSILPTYWDDKKREVKKTYPRTSSVSRLNNQLLKVRANAMDIINGLDEKGELQYLSVGQVKEKIVNQNQFESFYQFGHSLVEEMRASQRFGNARSYEAVLSVLKSFHPKELRFNELNYDFLKKFEQYHLSKSGNSLNGLASYMRTIRAIYNRGIKAGIIEQEAYPFNRYEIRQKPTEKRAINEEQLKKILSLEIGNEHSLFHARNYFLISYMLFGISFVDMAFLRVSNMIDGRIQYRRRKTGKLYDIKITPQLEELLTYYLEGKDKDDFILPIVKRDELENQLDDARWALRAYNRKLKELGELCEIDQKLTSYVSRHSFATQALLKEVPVMAISEMLGHSKLNTTQTYLKSLPNNVLDAYQDLITKILP
ncbi:site-specific integrase [Gilvibacter sediminis]|uniref:site-specific integrase n=1 Tax=Gilvibacter sediminis TaxID=379071 RepID=UPI00235085DA|nr:site-specific integrase [Gilvibacter sediminis]MDC7996921.1 site-specific integrase [Gilvibacter sediminis]